MRIHAIQTGSVALKQRQLHGEGSGPMRVVKTMADRRWTEPKPILAWLIEHPEGLIVVDTGETGRASEPGYLPRWHPYFRFAIRTYVDADEEIGPQLDRLGFSAGDVKTVILTHLHTDHAGGVHHFPRSEILVSREELAFAKGAAGRVRGYLPHRWPSWFDPTAFEFEERPFGPFPRSRTVTGAGDVTLIATPGHTPGHASVAVRTDDRVVVLAGDTSYTEQLMLDGEPDGVTGDVPTARQTLARMRELAGSEPTVYLPAHDPDARRRLEGMEAVAGAARTS